MTKITAKSLGDAGFVLASRLARRGLFPVDGAEIVIFKDKEYLRADATICKMSSDEWAKYRLLYPRINEVPDADGRFIVDQTESVASETEWGRRGRRLAPDAQAVAWLQGKHVDYYVYRESDTIAKRPAPKVVDGKDLGVDSLLAAIFMVNRAAKRRRDAASAQYEAGNHGFARHQRSKKEGLYGLKDLGIRAAIGLGLLEFDGIHGNLAIWAGSGYRFHSTLAPAGIQVDQSQDYHTTEAKPKEAKEPRIIDAIATIEARTAPCANDLRLTNLKPPAFERAPQRRFREEWEDDEQD